MTRTRPLPYLFLMSGTRQTSSSTSEFARLLFRPVRPDNEQRSCHRASFVARLSPKSSASLPCLSSAGDCAGAPVILTVHLHTVMAGPVPAIHVLKPSRLGQDVDARDKPGHDDEGLLLRFSAPP